MTVELSPVMLRWGAGAAGSPKANAALHATFLAIATVTRKSRVTDGAGGQVDTYATVATAACNFEPSQIKPREHEYAEYVQNLRFWDFHFVPGSVDVQTTDRLVVGSRTFEVIGTGLGSSTVVLIVVTLEIL